MFKTKTELDRRIIEISIRFNLTGIFKWLEAGAKREDIIKIDRDYGDSFIKSYIIDMIPIGKTSNAFYHRGKGLISESLDGIDDLRNLDEESKSYLKKQSLDTLNLQWRILQGQLELIITVNEKVYIIAVTPILTEVAELESTGEIKSSKESSDNDDIKISVPISFNKDGSIKDSIDMWKSYAFLGHSSVSYHNGLGSVSFSVPHFNVEY